MRKIGVIGNAGNGAEIGGQITKTVELLDYLSSRNISCDFYNVRERQIIRLLKGCQNVIKNADDVIIIMASTGHFKILPFIIWWSRKYNTNIHEIVIGGVRHEYIKKFKWRLSLERKVDKIYVESTYMQEEYRKLGLGQAQYLPNYKTFKKLERAGKPREGNLRICTFSRIDEYKGIDTAIDIVRELNKKEKKSVLLDIYGPIKESYVSTIKRKMKDSEKYGITYKGVIPTDKAQDVLKEYDVLIFPSCWETEGFPGTFIDALSAGLPIISSYRINFTDVVKEGYNGYLIKEWNDIDSYVEVLQKLLQDKEKLTEMKSNALKSAELYQTEEVLKTVLKNIG